MQEASASAPQSRDSPEPRTPHAGHRDRSIRRRHALTFGIVVFSFTSTAGTANEFAVTRADPRRGVNLPGARHTTSIDATARNSSVESGSLTQNSTGACLLTVIPQQQVLRVMRVLVHGDEFATVQQKDATAHNGILRLNRRGSCSRLPTPHARAWSRRPPPYRHDRIHRSPDAQQDKRIGTFRRHAPPQTHDRNHRERPARPSSPSATFGVRRSRAGPIGPATPQPHRARSQRVATSGSQDAGRRESRATSRDADRYVRGSSGRA
jgi:hypothetical protein